MSRAIPHRPRHHQRQHIGRHVDQRVLPRIEQRLERRRHVVDAIMRRQDLQILRPDPLVAGFGAHWRRIVWELAREDTATPALPGIEIPGYPL